MEKINEEQLESTNVNLNAVEHNLNEPDNIDETGSSVLKKFKSVEELEKAYSNLEKEFTKKCQRLKVLESENNLKNVEEELPQEKSESFLSKMSSFLKENENAKDYVNEITEILSNDENLAKKEDALELAYSKVLKQNFKTEEELLTDGAFLENIYNNEQIRNKILEKYLLDLESNKTVPLISSITGSLSMSSPKYVPKSLKEAGRFAENILKK